MSPMLISSLAALLVALCLLAIALLLRRIVRKEESLEKKLLGKTPKKILKFLQGSDGISTIGEIASENFIPEKQAELYVAELEAAGEVEVKRRRVVKR